ncbi:MAG: UDP-N-acetylglucosamine 2-epimerase (non-hydrolyzing) [Clostridiales Family XIII bacterium]|jgi:UDP-N-acetylglucosamine 2-epimerase (non-hydrolysing)|nr:UDP-N-acetylglucosamine 2-epimerase (non-hydrolyzing) [Clostridiales Family XIII bacterium]
MVQSVKNIKHKIHVVIGTRPEAIKMAPLIKELERRPEQFEASVVATGQHREMLAQVLDSFEIIPAHDLDIMRHGQTLADITTRVLNGMTELLRLERPSAVLVHGDTTTAMAAAMAAFYEEIPIGHVEAGLRTYNTREPFPEEFNRQCIGSMASYHFAPTALAEKNLLDEHKDPDRIIVTGNTAIDALALTLHDAYSTPDLDWVCDDRLILVTCHRRENLGENMRAIFTALRRIVTDYPDTKVIYPVHLNPRIQQKAKDILGDSDRVRLIDPLAVIDFHNYMNRAYLILTDSGGVQEEAPSMGKPVLVARNVTERPEGVDAGTLKIAGVAEEGVYASIAELLDDSALYERMAGAKNPYGDGHASERIADFLWKTLSITCSG